MTRKTQALLDIEARAREAWNEAKASTFEHGATKG